MPSYKNNLPIQTTINFDTIPTVGSPNAVTSDGIYNSLLLKQDALTNPVTGTGTAGQVSYWSGTGTQTGSNNLFWDAANSRLGVGTNAPNRLMQLSGTDRRLLSVYNTGNNSSLIMFQNAQTGVGDSDGFAIGIDDLENGWLHNYENTNTIFTTNATERLRITSAGNVLINNTDGTGRLTVRGSGTTSATTALLVQNSTPTDLLTVRDDGLISILSQINIGNRPISIYPSSDGSTVNNNGRGLVFSFIASPSAAYNAITLSHGNLQHTTDGYIISNTIGTFNPTSGTATYTGNRIAPTINQTGGANGITRGLYVNPTLTAAADWRSVEFSNNTGWGIYGAGTADSYFGGRISIGTTLQSQGLRIGRNPTAADSRTIFVNPNIQNTVTSNYVGITTSIGLSTSGFTLPNLAHYEAINDGTHTAGVVTNLFAYREKLGTYSATNVYGFYGDIPSGTGRWNLYMNGTAANYLAGNTSIGTTTSSGRLTVQGSGTTSATTALLVQNSGATNIMGCLDSRTTYFGSTSGYNGTVEVNLAGHASRLMKIGQFEFTQGSGASYTGQGIRVDGANRTFIFNISNDNTTDLSAFTFEGGGISAGTGFSSRTTGTINWILTNNAGFAPTSGTANFNQFVLSGTINQTGGANGITRGLYVNPTLTSAADWRGIESVATSNANHTLLKLRNATVDVFTVKADSKIGFYNATPAAQATTGIAEAAFVENSGGTTVNVDSTFAGYTLQQIAQALKDYGLLA